MKIANVFVAALLVAVACSGDDADSPAGGAGQAAGGAPGRRGRPAAVITLAASDVSTVGRQTIEDGVALTGDLRPIQTVAIRARLEGDLDGVYVREGQHVTAGQLLAKFENSEEESNRASAEADRVAAQSELATAQWNLEQTSELYRAGAVSELDLKTAQQNVTSARARLAAAVARLRAASSVVNDTRVLATTTGTISRRMVEPGEHVSRGEELFELVRSDVLELAAAVPARRANAVRTGMTVHFSADGRAFDGKVARVSPTVDPASRSVAVYVQIPNPDGAIKGGTFASGRVVSRVIAGALVVPSTAVRQSADDGKPYVYRLAGKNVDIADIQIGVVDERVGLTQVLGGLAEGDRVISGNVGALGRGMQVIIAGGEEEAVRAQSGAAAARQ